PAAPAAPAAPAQGQAPAGLSGAGGFGAGAAGGSLLSAALGGAATRKTGEVPRQAGEVAKPQEGGKSAEPESKSAPNLSDQMAQADRARKLRQKPQSEWDAADRELIDEAIRKGWIPPDA